MKGVNKTPYEYVFYILLFGAFLFIVISAYSLLTGVELMNVDFFEIFGDFIAMLAAKVPWL